MGRWLRNKENSRDGDEKTAAGGGKGKTLSVGSKGQQEVDMETGEYRERV